MRRRRGCGPHPVESTDSLSVSGAGRVPSARDIVARAVGHVARIGWTRDGTPVGPAAGQAPVDPGPSPGMVRAT